MSFEWTSVFWPTLGAESRCGLVLLPSRERTTLLSCGRILEWSLSEATSPEKALQLSRTWRSRYPIGAGLVQSLPLIRVSSGVDPR